MNKKLLHSLKDNLFFLKKKKSFVNVKSAISGAAVVEAAETAAIPRRDIRAGRGKRSMSSSACNAWEIV